MTPLLALIVTVGLWFGEGGPLARVYAHERIEPAEAARQVCMALRGEKVELPVPFELYVDEPTPTGAFVPKLVGKGVVEECAAAGQPA